VIGTSLNGLCAVGSETSVILTSPGLIQGSGEVRGTRHTGEYATARCLKNKRDRAPFPVTVRGRYRGVVALN